MFISVFKHRGVVAAVGVCLLLAGWGWSGGAFAASDGESVVSASVARGETAVLPHPAAFVLWVVVLGFLFAKTEVQIEGGSGWAAALPTWRIEKHRLLDLFWGGRPMTGYHAWVFTFMAAVFHLPMFLARTWSARLEARILGGLMIFWIVEDFLWFVLNPAFGIRKFRKGDVPWHRRWVGPLPFDYVLFLVVGWALLAWSAR